MTDSNAQARELARNAARTAAPFLNQLSGRYRDIVAGLRNGRDAEALLSLSETTEDLEHFIRFLVLIDDFVEPTDPQASTQMRDYRNRILRVVESIEPALGDVDLVEVADALEDDLLPALGDYKHFDDAILHAVGA